MAGGGGVARLGVSARKNRRGFLKGSERPEAGCLGEYNVQTCISVYT